MEYEFSWAWFLGGIGIIAAATLFIRFHQWVADNFGSGFADYDRYKLYGLIALGVGFLTMTNLAPALLTLAFSMIFGRGSASSSDTLEPAMLLLHLLTP
jgi:hypothetical protein